AFPAPTKLTTDQEQIAAEITRRLLRGRSGPPRQIVLNRVRDEINTLSRALPIAKKLFKRQENKAHAKKIIEAIDTLKQLIKTAPEGLTSSFFLGSACDEDSFYRQLNHIRNGYCYGLIGPDFGLHHRVDLAGQWCAQSAVTLIKELAPMANI